MPLPAIAAAALPAAIGAVGQMATNAANVKLSREQMAFQERMSSSAHQREVADLTKAGLNPMLSAMKGSGASTPSGSVATVSSAAGAGVSTALAAMRQREEIKLLQAQQEKVGAEANAVRIQNELWSPTNNASPALNYDRLRNEVRRGEHEASISEAEAERLTRLLPHRVQELLAAIEASSASADAARMNTHIRSLYDLVNAENMGRFERSVIGKVLPFVSGTAKGSGELLKGLTSLRWIPGALK